MDFTESFLERYEELAVSVNYLKDKVTNLTRTLEEKDRHNTILAKTTRCFNDFIDNSDLRCDYERFKDKWLAQEESK